MIGSELNYLLLGLSLLLLGIASWQDFKFREVIEWVWFCMIVGGILIHVTQLLLQISANESPVEIFTAWIINIIFGFALALFIFYSGLMGEADAIAILAIAIITPINQPIIVFNDPQYDVIIKFIPRILGTFFNAHLFAISAPILIFCYNLVNKLVNAELYRLPNESLWVRFVILFIGYPHLTNNISEEIEQKPWHFDLLEEFIEESKWKIVFRARLDTPEADIKRKKDLVSLIKAENKKHIWIQPSPPGIFYLTLGYFADIILGNIIMIYMALIVN
ncbi:MAG: prepilin peptidase [Candidatus Hodarchaeota archaeon]